MGEAAQEALRVWQYILARDQLPLVVVLLPGTLGLLAYLLGKGWRPLASWLSALALLGNLLVSLWLLWGEALPLSRPLALIASPNAQLPLMLDLSRLSASFIVLLALVSAAVGLHNLDDSAGRERPQALLFFGLLGLSAANAILASGDLVTLYMASWCLSLSLLGMVSSASGEAGAGAGAKALLALEGTGLLVLGAVFLAQPHLQDLSVSGVANVLADADDPVLRLLAVLLIVPFAVRAAVFPLHGWLSGVIRALPPSVSAWAMALNTLGGFYLVLRFFAPAAATWPQLGLLLTALGATAVAAAGVGSYRQHSIRPLLAFQALGQGGLVVVGLGLGTDFGRAAGLYQLISQAFYLSLLSICLASMSAGAHSTRLQDLGETAGQAPLALAGGVVACLSLIAAPASAGYGPRYLLAQAAVLTGRQEELALLVVTLLGSTLLGVSAIRLLAAILASAARAEGKLLTWRGQTAAMALLLVICMLSALAPTLLFRGLLDPMSEIRLEAGPGGSYRGEPAELAALSTALVLASLGLAIWLYRRAPAPPEPADFSAASPVLTLVGQGQQASVQPPALVRAYRWVEGGGLDILDNVSAAVMLTARLCAVLARGTLGRLSR